MKAPARPRRRARIVQALIRSFLRGLLFVAPVAATVYVLWFVIGNLDAWIGVERLLGRRIPGAGIVLTALLITLIGFLAGNFATRWLFHGLEELFARTPFVKLLYTSLKDLIGAFVGDKKSFDRPVLISLGERADMETVGFVTRDDSSGLGLDGRVAVYVPQAYNFGGMVVLVPRERVRPLDADPSAVMAFVMSGGIAGEIRSAAVSRRPG